MDIHKPSCLLLCSYPKTGRDTFVDNLLLFGNRDWVIYSKDKSKNENYFYRLRYRLSFEDEGKKLAAQMLGLPFSIDEFDRLKDKMIISTRLLREQLRDILAKERLKNKDNAYWVKKGIESANQKKIDENLKDMIEDEKDEMIEYIVPDFSYTYEMEYLQSLGWNVETARFFRKEVEIPTTRDKGYHVLDQFVTDYLFLPKENHEEHFSEVLKAFPQYIGYSKI